MKNRNCKRYIAWLAHGTNPARSWVFVGKDDSGNDIIKNTETGEVKTYGSGNAYTKNGYLMSEKFTNFPSEVGGLHMEVERATSTEDPNVGDKNATSIVSIYKPGDIPKSWDTNSAEFKNWKKGYNAWYYRNNPEKWNLDKSPMSSTSNAYKNDAYKQAAEARARANSNRVNRVGTRNRSNAQKMLDRSAADAGPSRPRFGEELFNAKTRLNDLWSAGAGSIASAGKSVINKAKANRSSFNDMWANGASAIASAGKSFLKNWMAGIGK